MAASTLSREIAERVAARRRRRGAPASTARAMIDVQDVIEAMAEQQQRGAASLSDRERKLQLILQSALAGGKPVPTQRELARRMGDSSQSHTHYTLHALARAGWIRIRAGQRRAITVLRFIPTEIADR